MTHRLKIYLAGPIRGCSAEQRTWWRESIGTTLGIVRARPQGKPVVVDDPNRIHNAILMRLVAGGEAHGRRGCVFPAKPISDST